MSNVKRFPLDCTGDCRHHKKWCAYPGISVHRCELLHVKMYVDGEMEDKYKQGIVDMPLCPIEEEKRKEIAELKRCPFCNSDQLEIKEVVPEYSVDIPFPDYKIVCLTCNASTGLYGAKKAAISAWNKRA